MTYPPTPEILRNRDTRVWVGLTNKRGQLTIAPFRRDRYMPALPPGLYLGLWTRSSAVEHYVDIVGVTGSIPVASTIL